MFPVLIVAAAIVPAPEDPPTCLDDAYRFNVPGEVAHANYQLARDHLGQMKDCVWLNNTPAVAAQWWAEQRWRLQVWSDLEDVLYHKTDPQAALFKLRRVRELLGERDYWSGRAPMPLCRYEWRER